MSSDALMDELQSFLDMGASPSPSVLGPSPSPRGSVPKQQEGVPSPSSAPLSSYTDVKRKLDASPGHDEIGSYNLNSPAKMPKMEGVKEEPGLARSGSFSNLRNLNSVGAMSGGTVKTEVDPLGPGGPGIPQVGMGFKSESGLDETGEGLVGGEGHHETPVEPDKQKCHATAARIRGALEASGLSGNLTSEDLQTLKRLNDIAKSTGLTQEQKSGEASQLLKNNPNVSRLLLKLRTEKNIQNQNSGMGRGTGPLGRAPEGVGMAAGGGGRMEPAYPTMQGTRPVNPTGGAYGQAGYGGPGMPGPVYRGQMPPGGQWGGQGHPAQQGPQEGFYRSVHGGMGRGGQMGMMEMNPMGQQGMRMHPEMMGPGGPPVGYGGGGYSDPHGMRMMRMPGAHMYNNHMGGAGPMSGSRVGGPMDRAPGTVYMNRQTGMTMYQEHPGSMPNMSGMNSRPPPGYGASSVGSPYIPSGNFQPGQLIRGEPGMAPGPRSPYGGMVPGMQRPGYGSPQGAAGGQGGQQGAQGGFDTFQGGEMGARGRWEEPGGRENLLTSMPRGSPQPLPPVSESQLRARLSGVTTTSSSNPSSELASRLMAGKNFESGSGYQAAQGQPRIVGPTNSAPGIHDSSTDSLFNEINNSQFLQNTAPTNNYAGKFEDFASEKVVGSWKESQNTNDLRSSWLSRLSKALETSANINSAEAASRMAGDIEEKAFQSADTEVAYANNIAVQLARIFSQQSKGEGSTSRPDSTSWQEESTAPSSTSPDYGTNTQAHFPTDTTLNFQDKADISESSGAFHDTKDFHQQHQANQQHQHQQQQHQQQSSSSSSPSMKQPGQQEGGPSTGQHANVIIPRGGRRPSGKQGPAAQPHSVDSGIESPRSILGSQFSPNPAKSSVSGASPSVTLAENSPEK